MSPDKNRSVDPRVRLAIARWPDDAPRGAVTTFCAEQGIWRKTFYVLRRRALEEGPAAVLEPRSRHPRTSPSRLPDRVRARALDVRAALERSGLDHGPISVHDKMAAMGLEAPSPASLARIFRQEGVARAEPSKRPRAAWRRFVYPAPNACWQLDATEYVLAGGRKAVIFQLQDDHSRLAVASLVAPGETSQAAIDVFDKGVAARGAHPAPARPTTARPRAPAGAESPAAWWSTCAPWASNPPAGRPYRPTTQGKNERFHQTLLRHPGRQPLADSIAELQEQVDRFDHIYNTQRPHQGLPGRITPQQAQDATEVARAPRPGHDTDPITPGGEPARDAPAGRRPPHRRRPIAPSGEREAGHHPQRHRPHRRHRVPGPPRPGRAPNHRDLGRHHHHLRRRPRRGPDPVQLAARRRHPRLPPPARPHQPTRRPRPQEAPTVTEVLTHRTPPMS